MLPGFRFLVAAIVLSMSILVFGLGAAALLRAAHEEVASRPSWRAAPETVFAQQNEVAQPVLAMLRLEPPVEQRAPEPIATVETPAEPIAATPAELEKIAALKPEDSSQAETATPETPAPEKSTRSEVAPLQEIAATPADETRIAAIEQIASAANEAAAVSEPASPPVLQNTDIAATKIATLGGPSVTIEPRPAAKKLDAKPDRSAVKKREQARRAAHRRKIALRARTAQAPPQPAADPFSQPNIQPAITVRKR